MKAQAQGSRLPVPAFGASAARRAENDNNSNNKIDGVRRQQAILVGKVLAEGKELGKLYVFSLEKGFL